MRSAAETTARDYFLQRLQTERKGRTLTEANDMDVCVTSVMDPATVCRGNTKRQRDHHQRWPMATKRTSAGNSHAHATRHWRGKRTAAGGMRRRRRRTRVMMRALLSAMLNALYSRHKASTHATVRAAKWRIGLPLRRTDRTSLPPRSSGQSSRQNDPSHRITRQH